MNLKAKLRLMRKLEDANITSNKIIIEGMLERTMILSRMKLPKA